MLACQLAQRLRQLGEVAIGPVDLVIPEGGITALIGPNGAGKSTLLTMIGNYPDAETREMILATGMADGMETSYARLEREVLGV